MTGFASRQVVHRDLKPENILLACKKEDLPPGVEPEIKVADFGLARVISDKDMMRTACGTPGWATTPRDHAAPPCLPC